MSTDRVKVDLDLPSKVVLLANYVPKKDSENENIAVEQNEEADD